MKGWVDVKELNLKLLYDGYIVDKRISLLEKP